MPIIGFILIISGLLVITYFSGPKSNSEQSNPPPQGQVQALPVTSPTSANAEPMHSILDTQTGQTIHVPESKLGRYGIQLPQAQTHVTKASDKALQLSSYIFTYSNEKTRNELINKFSNGKGDLSLAVNNLALLLDSKPEALVLAEKDVAQDIASKKELEERNAIGEYHRKEYERLKAELDNTIAGINNTYIGGTQNTYIKSSLPNESRSKTEYTQRDNAYLEGLGKSYAQNLSSILSNEKSTPSNGVKASPWFIQRGSQQTDSLGNTHFYNDDGSTGMAHTDSLGNTQYNDSFGRSSFTSRDSLGNDHTLNNLGESIDSHTNSLGITSHYGSNGLSGTSRTDSLGNTYYDDNFGNNLVCHTNSLGYTTCD